MAAATPSLVSDLFVEPGHWLEHTPDWGVLQNTFSAASGQDANQIRRHLVNLNHRSPTTVVFCIVGDPDHIYACHTPTLFPGNPAAATPFDDLCVVLLGDDIDAATTNVLPGNCFARRVVRALTHAYLTGAHGHGAAPPVFRHGPHAAGAADTDEVEFRPVFLMDPAHAPDLMLERPNGVYTLLAFYDLFIRGPATSGDAAQEAYIAPLLNWYRAACTTDANGHPAHAITPVTSALPLQNLLLQSWAGRTKFQMKTALGTGGPGLTSVAFNAGVTSLETAIRETSAAAITYQRDASQKTFTEQYGTAIAQLMYNLSNTTRDEDIPDIHKLLAKSPKGRAYAILASYLEERAYASELPLTSGCLPLASTKLVDQVFRAFKPACVGTTFGEGLSPFSCVCEGHVEAQTVQLMVKKAEIAEQSASMTLTDAERLTSTDVRFPTTPQTAIEKLYAWSIVVDLFHGVAHPIADNVRAFVKAVGPGLHVIYSQATVPATGMSYVNRVLYEAQQDYFRWASCTARENRAAHRPAAPTFDRIIDAVLTFRVSSLSEIPNHWYDMLELPPPTPERTANQERAPRAQAASTAVFNAHADRSMLTRFRESEFPNISSMMEGKDVTIPKHAGKDVCLVWALKGECSAGCKRKAQHVRYSQATNRSISELLTKCGVPAAQV